MAGFSNYDDLISKLTISGQGKTVEFFKAAYTPQGNGFWYTYWPVAGIPGAGAAPAATPGTAYVNAAGSIAFGDQALSQKHLLTFGAVSTQWGNLLLYDRLVGVGGVALAPAGIQPVNSTALPRYTDGAGVRVWVEVTTATVGAGTVALSSYTNQDGVAGRVGAAVSFPFAASNVGTALELALQAGDTGVRSVETVTTATSTAGAINVVLAKPLVSLPLTQNFYTDKDMILQIASMPRLYDGASLAFLYQYLGTIEARFWGQLSIGWG